ncbi:hypothetical protein FRC06_010345 [Ceratobasidium sp. 370]|nr:hypothetical protein FRC06_010345 [Ceratobasidium sp. 370]
MCAGPFLPRLQSLASLSSLSVSLSMIDADGLLVLGGLPQLRTLTIWRKKKISIPGDSFPQLTSLTLWEVYIHVVAELMATQSLANNLTHLSICHWFEEEAEVEQTSRFEEAIPLLLVHTSRLKSFHYDATYNPSPLSAHLMQGTISRSFLQRTSDIKLDDISLVGLGFTTIETLEVVPASLSTLVSLSITHGFVSPDELKYFAVLPTLQSLTLQLGLGYNIIWPGFEGNQTGLALRTIVSTEDKVELEAGVDERMIASSRFCFPIAASRVWEQVDNARVLLKLIGTNSLRDDRYRDFKDEVTIDLDGVADFGRFDVYAPLVKHLDVYGKEHKHFKVKPWRTLFQRAREQPLLPNLLSLTLYATNSRFAIDQILWVSAFASPSLIQFSPVYVRDSNKCLVSDTGTSIILKTLSERSPNIQSLALYREIEAGPGEEDGESCFLNLIWDGPFLQHLKSLVNLRELSIGLSMIDGDGLLALGRLPQLADLTIRGCHDYLEEEIFSIPDDSFPQLTRLKLWEIYIRLVARLMAIKPLARHLVDLSICHWFEEEGLEEQVDWFEEAIPLLLQHTSRLKSFYYDATYSAGPFLPIQGGISQSLLRRTSELKLEGIFLFGLLFMTIETLESMSASWSTLTVLNIKQPSPPQILPYFAKLPNLQALTLQIRLADYNDWPVFEGFTSPALHTLITSDDRIELDTGVNAFSVVRSLLSLWPNLRAVRWPAVESRQFPVSASSPRLFLDTINRLLQPASELIAAQESIGMDQGLASLD